MDTYVPSNQLVYEFGGDKSHPPTKFTCNEFATETKLKHNQNKFALIP